MILQLTKQSTDQEIKAYFEEVLRMSKDSEEFPVNLDEVWPLVFGRKEEAVRALKNDRLFVENIDFQVLRRNAENLDSFTQRCVKPVIPPKRQAAAYTVFRPRDGCGSSIGNL